MFMNKKNLLKMAILYLRARAVKRLLLLTITFIPSLELIELLELLGCLLNIIHSSPLHYGVLRCGRWQQQWQQLESFLGRKNNSREARDTGEHALHRLVGLNSCLVHLLHGCVTGRIFAYSAHLGQGCYET